MDFRTTVLKTLLGEEVTIQLDEETLSLIEENSFDEFSDETLLDIMESILFQHLDEKLSKGAYVSAAQRTSDPDYMGSVDYSKVVNRAKKVHGDKFAKQLSNVQKGHWPKQYGKEHKMVPHGYDKMDFRNNRSTNPNMVTKSGKLTKTAQKGLKTDLK